MAALAFLWPFVRPLLPYIIMAAVAGGGFLYLKTHYYNKGWKDALHAVAVKDDKAVKEARDAEATVAECERSGRSWNVVDGVCQ